MQKQLSKEGSGRSHVKCPGCGNEIISYDGSSTYFGCVSCGIFFKPDIEGEAEIIKKFYPSNVVIPAIPLGSTGRLNDRDFTVVAYLQKKDVVQEVSWTEYLLISPGVANYYTLAEYNGHWMLIWKKEIVNAELFNLGYSYDPKYEIRISYPYRRFKQFTIYNFDILWATGEFDWNILDEVEKMEVIEFIDPPDMIVQETIYGEMQWYWGTHVDQKDVAGAFGISARDLPRKIGAGALELRSFQQQLGPLKKFTILAVVLVIIAQLMIGTLKPAATVFTENYSLDRDTASWSGANPVVSPSFNMTRAGAANIDLQTNISNEWIELAVSLVNENSGRTYEFTKVLEYYHGAEDGESWSEGSSDESGVFSNLPAGRYHLNIYPYFDSNKQIVLTVRVEQNTLLYSNLVWMLIALLIFPCIQYLRNSSFENHRWLG